MVYSFLTLSGQSTIARMLPILLDLLAEPAEQADVLRRWCGSLGAVGPMDALTAPDFGAFEDALADLADRGFVLRG